ncbi:MAG: HDOD domain-containing protein [Desulfosarcina sp.]|nr:HDOD domain-containing protein [Desulfobacterales bacterium]
MPIDRLKAIIGRVEDLPTLPRTVFRITEIINNPKSSARDLAGVINDDQVLTARLLRLVNSSFYGFPQRIATVNFAIVLLGFDAIRNLLLTTSVFDIFAGADRDLQIEREKLWDHSLGCAVAAKVIGKHIRYDKVEELFVCGLLHDIGKIVEMAYLKKDYTRIRARVLAQNELMVKAEEDILGCNHAHIGHLLAERWNLPAPVPEVVLYHHTPDQAGEFFREAATVHLADIFCRALEIGSGGDHLIPQLCQPAWEALELERSDIEALLREIETEYQDIRPFIQASEALSSEDREGRNDR